MRKHGTIQCPIVGGLGIVLNVQLLVYFLEARYFYRHEFFNTYWNIIENVGCQSCYSALYLVIDVAICLGLISICPTVGRHRSRHVVPSSPTSKMFR